MKALSRIGSLPSALGLALMGVWFRWGCRYRVDASLRSQLRAELKRGGELLLCANHSSPRDGWLVRWILGSGSLWIVADARSPFAKPWSRLLFALGRTIAVSQRHGLYANRRAFERIGLRLARREPVLIFPEGTENLSGQVDVEQYSYLVGKLRRDRPDLKVLCVGLGEDGADLRLVWRMVPPERGSTGLRGVRDLGRQINLTLKELELAHR